MVTITYTHINGVELDTPQIQDITQEMVDRFESTNNTTGGFALITLKSNQGINSGAKLQCNDTYANIKNALTQDAAESGAELLANKATTFGTINDTKYPSVEAVTEVFGPIWYAAANGTNTYAATLTGLVPTAYYAGMRVRLTFGNANTGASTINLNGLGAKAITKGPSATAAAMVSGDIESGIMYELVYDGTQFQVAIDGMHNNAGLAAGTNTYTLTINYPGSYTGKIFAFSVGNTNTGAATLSINGLGAKALTKGTSGTTALSAGDLVVGKMYLAAYDGTRFQILNLV